MDSSWKVFMLTAVELSAMATASTAACGPVIPKANASPAVKPPVSATCKPPPSIAALRRCFNSLSENSMPRVNISSVTPVSASTVISSKLSPPSHCSRPEFAAATPQAK